MTITLDYKLKDELDEDEIARLDQLHLKRGLMWGYFQKDDDCSVVLALTGGKIVGWGLVYYNEDKECHEFHTYVSKYNRRMGIGTRIFELACEIFPEGLWVSRWSEEAEAFYDQFETLEVESDEDDDEIKDGKDNE